MLMSAILLTLQFSFAQAPQQDDRPAVRGRTPAAASPVTLGRRGGDSKREEANEAKEVKVFAIKHGSATSLAHIVMLACGVRAVADERSNSVVMTGTSSQIAESERLLAKLDQPVADARSEYETLKLIRVKHREVSGVAQQLAQIYEGYSISFSVDRKLSVIVARGLNSLVEEAESVVASLDAPDVSVELEYAFLKASPSETSVAGSPVPEDLAEVAAELKRFGKLELLGRASNMAVEHERFDVEGELANVLDMSISGRVLNASEEGDVKLEIRAALIDKRTRSNESGEAKQAERRSERPKLTIFTTVTTKMGEYVVLGIAPNGWKPGESAILVLSVRER